MEKSFVTLEQHICPVCGKTFDTGSLLMDTRVRGVFDKYTVTEFELCKDCLETAKEHHCVHVMLLEEQKRGESAVVDRVVIPEIFLDLISNEELRKKAEEMRGIFTTEKITTDSFRQAVDYFLEYAEHEGNTYKATGALMAEIVEKCFGKHR